MSLSTCVHMHYSVCVCWFVRALAEKNPYDRLTDRQTYAETAIRQPVCTHSSYCMWTVLTYTHTVHVRTHNLSAHFRFVPHAQSQLTHRVYLKEQTDSCCAIGARSKVVPNITSNLL